MKLPIEMWLDEAEIPKESKVAFREAVLCFKAGAYRAALLFSYVGWGLCIRDRVINSKIPTGISSGQWSTITNQLRDEDKWDAQAFDCTQMKNPSPVFEVSDAVRAQVRFWKDRRNDSAHFKLNEIGSAYVESFWSFVRSNLGRFVPRGSEADMLDRIERHFDPNYTPQDSDVSPLISMIPSAVEPARMESFLGDVKSRLSASTGRLIFLQQQEFITFVDGAVDSKDPNLQPATIDFLSKEPEELVSLLRHRPDRVLFWASNPGIIRNIWREQLFQAGHRDLRVYVALLRNDLIPKSEITEANEWVVNHLEGDIPDAHDFRDLEDSGFFISFKKVCFQDYQINEFEWGNRNADVVRWFIEKFPIDNEVANVVCSTFSAQPFPFNVRDRLEELFSSNANKKKEFEDVATNAGLQLPSHIFGP